jgi:hypothetical protein
MAAVALALAVAAPTPAPAPGHAPPAPKGEPAAPQRSATEWLDEAYRLKADGDLGGAELALVRARAAGADAQLVALERSYLDLARGDRPSARRHLSEAADGPDRRLAAQAAAELRQLPKRWSGDVYADAFGWSRLDGAERVRDVVPTIRVRAHLRPSLDLDASFYLAAQATRDTASTGGTQVALPRVYADNYALLAVGATAAFWERRIGVFAQAGPAFNLVDDGKPATAFDARAGAFLSVESADCRPGPSPGVRFGLRPCAEAYAEGTWLSRFDNDVVVFARGRAGATFVVTGPVAWQLLGEVRGSVDRNKDYYDNFVDAGACLRWRLQRVLPLDLSTGVYAGTYLGVEGVDPAPTPLTFVDLRAELSLSYEF